MQNPNPIPRVEPHWQSFASEIDELGRTLQRNTGAADFQQIRKFERWGRLSTALGYLTAWIFPNPISALLISQGNFTRWALVLHPISHGALDGVPGIPLHYTSRGFAEGHRRYLDWFDWIKPAHWDIEHNLLHHFQLGTDQDPDVVERNSAPIRALPLPRFLRLAFAVIAAGFWKPLYYAPNTMIEARHQKKLSPSNRLSIQTWNPLTAEGRELWLGCLLPYAFLRFAVIPLLFLPLGSSASLNVLITSLMAELFTNFHSFLTIGPNHTGDDVATFTGRTKSRAEFYFRQITGTVNFPEGSELKLFLYGGMNYQIEHHVFPRASLLQCQRARPELRRICAKYGVRYQVAPLLPRVAITFRTMAGAEKAAV